LISKPAVLLLGVLLALGVFTGACRGEDTNGSAANHTPLATEARGAPGDAAELDAYFADLLELLTLAQAEATEVRTSLTDQLTSAENVEDAKTIFDEGIDDFEAVARTFRDGLEELDPPDQVRSQHEEIVAAYDQGIDAFGEIKDTLDDVETETELIELSGRIGSQFADLTERTRTACAQLRTIAFDNGLSVALDC
jgi:hypothetical protein